MRTRYGLAAAFTVAIGLVLFLRNEGFLHGRVEGGPLTLTSADAAVGLAPRETIGIGIGLELSGAAVEIERVRPEFASPGLQVYGPRRAENGCATTCPLERWPPPGTIRLRGHVLDAPRADALLGLRATRPGVYYFHHLTTLYKRGIKAFRRRTAVDYCLVVRRTTAEPCTPGYRPPRGDAVVAEAGGPSRYGVPLTDGSARYTEPATLAITLTNLTDVRRRVEDLHADGADVEQLRPARVVIPPGQSRRVRLRIDGCADQPVDVLAGRVGDDLDTIPLSVPLVAAAC